MDGTYAPQSPDLSSFLSSPPKTQQPYQPQATSQSQSTAYAPRSPVIPSFNAPPSHIHNHNLAPVYPSFGPSGNEFAEYGNNSQYMPPIPALPTSHTFPHQGANTQPQYLTPSSDNSHLSLQYDQYISSPTMSSRGPRIKSDPSTSQLPSSSNPLRNPNPLNIEIKTKFPVARIKRIMQADEEVGKVAQVTPVAVSKALELFMIALVTGAAEKAKEKGGKKVTAGHLKAVVEGSEQFDFLADIVGKVSEGKAGDGEGGDGIGGKKRKEKSEKGSDDSEEESKKKKGRGRKKKSDD